MENVWTGSGRGGVTGRARENAEIPEREVKARAEKVERSSELVV